MFAAWNKEIQNKLNIIIKDYDDTIVLCYCGLLLLCLHININICTTPYVNKIIYRIAMLKYFNIALHLKIK